MVLCRMWKKNPAVTQDKALAKKSIDKNEKCFLHDLLAVISFALAELYWVNQLRFKIF